MTFPQPGDARHANGAALLRQRRSGAIPATIAEDGEQSIPRDASNPSNSYSIRRASSVMTDGSSSTDGRRASFRASTESLLLPPRAMSDDEPLHEEPSLWYSAPLLFAIVPAVGGVAFKSGSTLLTDVALLALAAIYLNWCLITPWIWYHSAQNVKLESPSFGDEIPEQALSEYLDDSAKNEDAAPEAGAFTEETDSTLPPADPAKVHPAAKIAETATVTREASAELAMHELVALAMCVLGPLIGSYILHIVRESLLSLHGGQLVSNMHLTLFVLGAELRPVRHCVKLVQARTLHLQRIVRSDSHTMDNDYRSTGDLKKFQQRLTELEASVASAREQQTLGSGTPDPVAISHDLKRSQQALQTQIDAVTRAVRRYEKRETTRIVQNDERLQDMEVRLREALSLAAAAAQNSQKSGLLLSLFEWLMAWVQSTLEMFMWPFKFLGDLCWSMVKKLGLARPIRRRKPVKRTSDLAKDSRERDRPHRKREEPVARPISDAWLKGRR
ncbi:MAG: hypothetical protein Q9159_000355 [Coniocarpon cinnabarinum]